MIRYSQNKSKPWKKQIGNPRRTNLQHACFCCLFLLFILLGGVTAAPDKKHELKADKAYAEGDFKKAVKEYKKAVKEEPKNVELRFKLAQAFLKKGEVDEAMAEFIRVTNMAPDHEGAYQHLGDFFSVKKQPDKAAKAYENLVRIKPDSAQYHFQLAKELDKLYQTDKALLHFYRTILLNPDVEDAYPYLFKLLRQKIVQNPQDPDAHMVLGRVYKLHGDMGEARAQFAVLVQLQPQARDGWEELLEVCTTLQDCQCETTALRGLLEFQPKNLAMIDRIVEVSRRCEMWDQAKEYLQLKTELAPGDATAYADLGRLYQRENNRIQTYFYFQKYLQNCSGCPDSDEIRHWCRNEELASPEIAAQYEGFLQFEAGVDAFRNGNFSTALSLLEQSKSQYFSFAPLHFYLGQTLEELDRRGEALFAYKEAIKLQPDNAEYWFFLGKALDALQMYSDAVVCFGKVTEVDPADTYGYGERTQNILQSYTEKGIMKKKKILE
ncbi:MAG: tetratricopeptide repeat protein [Acidobacteria bacterium]|nr:tetratricopeptide repeat protein [Acidobacteriota bacterium]